MTTPLPIQFRVSALNPTKTYTPQQFADAIAARLSIETSEELSLFVSGSAAPSTDSGPWLKDGVTWWVWSATVGAYIPQPLDLESLRYTASQVAPDPSKFIFWIQVDSTTGRPISINYYVSGSWVDIYADKFAQYSTTAEMNAAIEAAINNNYPFRVALTGADQNYTAGTGDAPIVFDETIFDPSTSVAAGLFTAKKAGYYTFRASIYIALDTGSPTGIDRQLKLLKNGSSFARSVIQVSDDTDGLTISIAGSCQLNIGDTVSAAVYVVSSGASTWNVINDSGTTYFEGNKIAG